MIFFYTRFFYLPRLLKILKGAWSQFKIICEGLYRLICLYVYLWGILQNIEIKEELRLNFYDKKKRITKPWTFLKQFLQNNSIHYKYWHIIIDIIKLRIFFIMKSKRNIPFWRLSTLKKINIISDGVDRHHV